MTGILNNPFQLGFLTGVFTMFLLAPFFFWMGVWLKKVRAFFRPQIVVQTTQQSPLGVLGQMLLYMTLLVGILVIAILFVFYLNTLG